MHKIILLTGISGAGKSVALNLLEDTGFTCVDNLPVRFLEEFLDHALNKGVERVAVAIDARTPDDLNDLPNVLHRLRELGLALRVIFLDASDHTLKQRYSESRRRHPLTDRLRAQGDSPSLSTCIQTERELLAPLRETEYLIDTTDLTPGQLRAWVRDIVQADRAPLVLTFESFAYKRAVPRDADLVFDVRCLPNPHYDPELRDLTGKDEAVAEWLSRFGSVQSLIDDIAQFVKRWLPLYIQDTRNYLTVAIGCTGGQHRSVYVTEQLARIFADHQPLLVRHRNQPPEQT
ncbi:MAG TPA: RNase adapter RapZ [Paenalcaligenes sp.]|nr:RNase adapter RapZ [Paenalcaligenes sp.]